MADARFEEFVGLIDALHKEIARIKLTEAQRLGFTGADVMCLYYLLDHPEGLTSAELARHAIVSRPAMSRTVTRLEERGLVEVEGGSGSNRYKALVRLTKEGIAATTPVDDVLSGVLDEVGTVLSDSRRSQVYKSLHLILEKLKQVSPND